MTAKGPVSGRSIVRIGMKRPSPGDSFLGRRLDEGDNSSKRARTEPLSEPKKLPGPFVENLLRVRSTYLTY